MSKKALWVKLLACETAWNVGESHQGQCQAEARDSQSSLEQGEVV